jgi:hypothetical protein
VSTWVGRRANVFIDGHAMCVAVLAADAQCCFIVQDVDTRRVYRVAESQLLPAAERTKEAPQLLA